MPENQKLNHLTCTAWTFLGMSIIWMALEKLLYGEVQHRTVDDIMSIPILAVTYLMWKFKAERDDLKSKVSGTNRIKHGKQYYISEHMKLYEKCLENAKKNNASDIYDSADKLYAENAETANIVGYYLYHYNDHALKTWKENLEIAKGNDKTDVDKEVTIILERLFCEN